MELTPMQQQYMEIKEAHPKEILFFRLGDFYVLLFLVAVFVSKVLGRCLTSRCGGVALCACSVWGYFIFCSLMLRLLLPMNWGLL